jgi:hypothetical protein
MSPIRMFLFLFILNLNVILTKAGERRCAYSSKLTYVKNCKPTYPPVIIMIYLENCKELNIIHVSQFVENAKQI